MHEKVDHVLLGALVLVPQQALTIHPVLLKEKEKPSAREKQLTKKKEPVSIESSEGRMWTTFNAQ